MTLGCARHEVDFEDDITARVGQVTSLVSERAERQGPEVDGAWMVLDPGVVAGDEVLGHRVVGIEGAGPMVRPDAQGRDRAGVV